MNLRALRKAKARAASAPPSPSTPRAALPAGETVVEGTKVAARESVVEGTKVAAPPVVDGAKVEPLPAHAGGRDEARAAFVADAGGAAPSPPPPPAGGAPPGGPAHGAARDAGGPPPLTVEQVAEFGVRILDTLAQSFGPRLGGEPRNWAQTDDERAMLVTAGTPLAAKWFADSKPSPEAMFIVALAAVYGPRAAAASAEKRKRAETAPRPVAPAPAQNEAGAPKPPPPPPPPPPGAPSRPTDVAGVFG